MADGSRLGAKVRALRRREGLTQARLAEQLSISSSYLNLIEHDKRPLTAALLIRLGQVFTLDLAQFAVDDDAAMTEGLLELLDDPLFDGLGLSNHDARDLARTAPSMAQAFVRLFRSYTEARESVQSLASRMADGQELSSSAAGGRLPSEEVTDFVQRHRNHFPELETVAEQVAIAAGLSGPDRYVALTRYLETTHGVRIRRVSTGPASRWLRRFDPARRELVIADVLEPHARDFQIATQIGLITQGALLTQLADDPMLSTEPSRRLCRIVLANYFAGALVMPYEPFLAAAQRDRYDIEILERRFQGSFEQVCHRLTTLRRPGREGIPFHFIKIDTAGNISKRFSGSGIRFARFGGACPRWNVNKALLSPETIRLQVSRMPDGSTYFGVARTVRKRRGGFRSAETVHAIGLGCEIEHASAMVYADNIDLDHADQAIVPIGVSCRVCDRQDCEQRAFPSLSTPLRLDENVRGTGFYASMPSEG